MKRMLDSLRGTSKSLCGSENFCNRCADEKVPMLPASSQLQQLRRTTRDALKHRRLRAASNPQPLDPELISAESDVGRALQQTATAGPAARALSAALFTQSHPAFCALASAAVIARASGSLPSSSATASGEEALPDTSVLAPFRPGVGAAEARRLPASWFHYWGFPLLDHLPDSWRWQVLNLVMYDGMPLGAVAELLRAYGLRTELFCGTQVSETALRAKLERVVQSDDQYLLMNVGRKALGQRGEGHFFLVGGLDAATDRALLLEVNGWRYPSVWARVPALHAAVQTTTPSGAPRGFVVVSKSSKAQPRGVRLDGELEGSSRAREFEDAEDDRARSPPAAASVAALRRAYA